MIFNKHNSNTVLALKIVSAIVAIPTTTYILLSISLSNTNMQQSSSTGGVPMEIIRQYNSEVELESMEYELKEKQYTQYSYSDIMKYKVDNSVFKYKGKEDNIVYYESNDSLLAIRCSVLNNKSKEEIKYELNKTISKDFNTEEDVQVDFLINDVEWSKSSYIISDGILIDYFTVIDNDIVIEFMLRVYHVSGLEEINAVNDILGSIEFYDN